MGLIARGLEARGLPTLSMSCMMDFSSAMKPPRTVFLDFPIGCPAGKPNEPELQREILRAALRTAPRFGNPWKIEELPFSWSADGSRDWEETLKEIYRNGVQTVIAHLADHRAHGESLLGREEEFRIRCNC